MKRIQKWATLAGLSLALLALGTTGAKAQSLGINLMSGSFTLNSQARLGAMTLPAGQYNVYYGKLDSGWASVVEIEGKAKGSPHGIIMVQDTDTNEAAENSLSCLRQGETTVIGALQMATIHKTVFFAMPRGVRLLAQRTHSSTNRLLAEASTRYEQIPVSMNQK